MGSQTRWIGAVAVVAILGVGLILWTVAQKKGLAKPTDAMLDSLVIGVVEKSMLPEARREVGRRCMQFLTDRPAVALRVQCDTSPQGVKVSRIEVLGSEDGGVVAPDFSACISQALGGLENGTTLVMDPRSDAGVRLSLPEGRSYELEIVLDFSSADQGTYIP